MVGDTVIEAGILLLTAIKKHYPKYQGYISTRIHETDKGMREEINRRLTMLSSHMDTMESRFLETRNTDGISGVNRIRKTIAQFSQDSVFTATGTTSQQSIAPTLSKKHAKALMEHDLSVLESIRETFQMVNKAQDKDAKGEEISRQDLMEIEQKIVGIRNKFNDRISYMEQI